jgi:hypothetical protein
MSQVTPNPGIGTPEGGSLFVDGILLAAVAAYLMLLAVWMLNEPGHAAPASQSPNLSHGRII